MRPADADLTTLFAADPDRARRLSRGAGPLFGDFSRRHLPDFSPLADRLERARVPERIRALFAGAVVNPSENRPALHWGCRAAGKLPDEWFAERDATRRRMDEIAQALRAGTWRGATGAVVTDVVCLGIGGSELGPRLAVEALGTSERPRLHFVPNVDGRPLARLMRRLDPARTLLVVTSKSFTTAETRRSADTLRAWLVETLGEAPDPARAQVIAITTRTERARDWGVPDEHVLSIPESVGGRYSLWSAAGLPVVIAAGPRRFNELLAGGREIDEHFATASLEDNLPALAGALDARCPTLAVVPYDERLRLLPPYLQQLYMESLGKSVDVSGRPLENWHSPVVFGATGTRAQHAFFQALHQGNGDTVTELIGVARPDHDLVEHHRALLANLMGQATALAFGDTGTGHRAVPGNRPCNVLLLDELTPYTLGALLAHYEHRVYTAAALADVNPFDQFGVELGKRLAEDLQSAVADEDPHTGASLQAILARLKSVNA